MEILTLPCGPIQANSYILYQQDRRDCVLIDPADGKLLLETLRGRDLHCTHILLTHGHFDHVWGVQAIREATGAQVYLHREDESLTSGKAPFVSAMQVALKPFVPDAYLTEGQLIEAAGISFQVLSCPGHTKGGVSFYCKKEGVVFTGDTLFYESVGRTDFPGGSIQELMDSLFNKLFLLPEDTKVYPGHMDATSIAHEKQFNPLLKFKEHPWFS